MTTALATTEHLTLVALSPTDLPATQAALAGWCQAKMRDLGQDYRELSANLRIAKKNRWSRGGLIKAVGMTKRRIQYYQKIRKAVEAGYLIVPNFPAEIMAVRVSRVNPPYKEGAYATEVNQAPAEKLPVGEGRYVDETTATTLLRERRVDEQGKTHHQVVEAGYFRDEIDFPVIAVKPQIMEATALAMALKVFDRIGVAHNGETQSSRRQRRADPIVVGQILDPKPKRYGQPKMVTFFIAWWLDTRSL